MSKIANPNLFKAVYEAVREAVMKGSVPDSYISANTSLFRAIDIKWVSLAPNGLVSKTSAEAAITPRDGAKDQNRFSGISPIPHFKSQSGLYLFRDENAGIAEMMHYSEKMNTLPVNVESKRISVPHLMATKAVFTIYPRHALILANLSVERGGSSVLNFFNSIENNPSVKSQLGGAKLSAKIMDGNDYSVSRAFGLALAAANYFSGLESPTARISDRPDQKGSNICIFGNDFSPVSFLVADSVMLTFSSSVLFDDSGQEIKLNSNEENLIKNFSPNAIGNEYTLKIDVDSGFKQTMRVTT